VTTPKPIAGPGELLALDLEVLDPAQVLAPIKYFSVNFGVNVSVAQVNQGLVVIQTCDTTAHVVLAADPVVVSQNSPNPFNPRTTVNLTVNRSGHVRLLVYDALGREVERPLDQDLANGEYPVVIDASQLTSGTYRYAVEWSSNGVMKRSMKAMTVIK